MFFLKKISIENTSIVSAAGAALLPPLPRSFLTQSVSLAPLSIHSISKKQQQAHQNISPCISTATSALNLSHDFEKHINMQRSKRLIRQLTPGSLSTQVVNFFNPKFKVQS